MSCTVVVDAGPLYAAADVNDSHHSACAAFLTEYRERSSCPSSSSPKTAYLLATRVGTHVELLFLAELGGTLSTEPVHPTDWPRTVELVAHRDFPLGATDASVIACAERLGVAEIATLDRRHFAAVRLRHVAAFWLLP